MTTNIEGDELTYGIDWGHPDGDQTALTILDGDISHLFFGEEAEVIAKLIQSEISKREQLLLDELEEAVGNAKYGEDQGFNYEQAVDDVYDFINAKREKQATLKKGDKDEQQ